MHMYGAQAYVVHQGPKTSLVGEGVVPKDASEESIKQNSI